MCGATNPAAVRPIRILDPPERRLRRPPTRSSYFPPARRSTWPILFFFKCYKVKHGTRNIPLVTIDDEFGSLSLRVRKAFRLCVPADKNGGHHRSADCADVLLHETGRRGATFPPPRVLGIGLDARPLLTPI